jgi:ribokinase
MSRVLMLPSVHMDPVVEKSTFPRLAQTLLRASFAMRAGGNAGNQAAARRGATVTILGGVGSDALGAQFEERLAGEGMATRWVHEAPSVLSGIAAITVCKADDAIIVVQASRRRWPS